MRGRAAELALRQISPPLFGEVSTEARTRVGVDLSRVSAGPASSGEEFAPARRAAKSIIHRFHNIICARSAGTASSPWAPRPG